MGRKVKIVLVGIGGYGNIYVDKILKKLDGGNFEIELTATVDPYPESCKRIEDIRRKGVPVYPTLEEFYRASDADLAVISSPIQFHCEHVCTALSNGSSVLCEKPVAATIQDVKKMMEAEKRTGKFVAVGYQWSFNQAILDLKRDILSGKFGSPRRLKTLVLWPRNADYYARGWAGRKKDNAGRWVLDSVAANATAHYLHNMFFLLGDEINKSVKLASVKAETYRANRIENYDTAVIRVFTEMGTEILFAASHAISTKESKGPEFEYEFDNAVVKYTYTGRESDSIKAILKDGSVIDYGCPDADYFNKLWTSVKAVSNGITVPCGLEAASSHTICINGVQESVPDPVQFPNEMLRFDDAGKVTYVEGLGDILNRCYHEWKMPCELGLPWSYEGREINLSDYAFFKGDS